MTRKGKSGKKKHIDSDSDLDDYRSVVSNDTVPSTYDDESIPVEKNSEENLDENIEKLTEKRSSSRIEALESVHRLLLQCLTVDCLEMRRDTMISNIVNCLRKPSKQEGILASQCIGIISITLGPDEDVLFCDVRTPLQNLLKNSSSDEVQSAALEALAMCCFICTTEEDYLDAMIELTVEYISVKSTPLLCSTAMQSWALLASILPPHYLVGECNKELQSNLLKLLDHPAADVRANAGETIAFLYECRVRANDPIPEKSMLLSKVEELMKSSSKKSSKKDRKDQRSVFRNVQRTIEDHVEPVVNMTIVHNPLSFKSWLKIKQLYAIKSMLGTGFHEHMQFNTYLRRIFDLGPPDSRPSRLAVNEKRVLMSKNSSTSRKRWDDRNRSRNTKREYQNIFYDND